MKFDPAKAWPHPVLRPKSYGDDYPRAEFEVEIEVYRAKGSTAVEARADFDLSDPTLLGLVETGLAEYLLLVRSTTTHSRLARRSFDKRISTSLSAGDLCGRVEFLPFLCSTNAIASFQAEGWHDDYAGRTFDIPAGAVLAQDVPRSYWIDTAEERPLGSIFGLRPEKGLKEGVWDCRLEEDRVWIVMSGPDFDRYNSARSSLDGTRDAQYLMNGLYLPALIWVLVEADKGSEEYEHCRWYASLSQRLEAVGCPVLGIGSANRAADAQKVLEYPFPKMPIMSE